MATAALGRFRNNEVGNFRTGLFAKSALITIHASRRAKRHAPIVVCEPKFLAALIASHKRDSSMAAQKERRDIECGSDEGGASRPHRSARTIHASNLGRNYRHDCQRAGVHDEIFIADQNIVVVAILRGIFHNRNRQIIELDCSRYDSADRD
jgi:hypothetical protein